MSRLAKKSITIPNAVKVEIVDVKDPNNNQLIKQIQVKGSKGSLSFNYNESIVHLQIEGNLIHLKPKQKDNMSALVGTTFRTIQNLIKGATEGFEKKLQLVGVGYRAKVQGNVLELSLGKSHPEFYEAPEGIKIDAPSATEIVVKGSKADQVGQVAAEIRDFRPPERYKGKGVRYDNEQISLKEVKKK